MPHCATTVLGLRLKSEFLGSKVAVETGLLAHRELGDAWGRWP